MRQIENYFDKVPKGLKPQTLIANGIITRILATKQVKTSDYKGRNKEVKNILLDIFHRCCAFCETRIGKYDDIEHFRPKHAIAGVNTEGYYWLAVVWWNLLVVCKSCNSDYKKNNFPILGTHIALPQHTDLIDFFAKIEIKQYASELPLLLHPVLDNPNEFLSFEEDGTVSAKNGNQRGLQSILYYGLSDWDKRKTLIQDRKVIIEDVRSRVNTSMRSFVNDARLYEDILNLLTDLIEQIEENRPYSAVRRACIANFKVFFIDKFIGVDKDRLESAYKKVIDQLQ